jgi:hypothetical protein
MWNCSWRTAHWHQTACLWWWPFWWRGICRRAAHCACQYVPFSYGFVRLSSNQQLEQGHEAGFEAGMQEGCCLEGRANANVWTQQQALGGRCMRPVAAGSTAPGAPQACLW